MHFIAAGIQSAGDPLDIAALAGSVPALIGDNDRDLLAVELIVQIPQFLLQTIQFFIVLLFAYSLVIQRHFRELGNWIKLEYILADRRGERMVFEGGVNALVEEAQDLQFSPFLIAGVNYVPGSRGAVCVLKILLVYVQIFLVMLVLVQVVVIHSPTGILVLHQVVQTLFLLFFADVEEELHHQVAVVGERALSCIDAAYPLLVLMLVDLAFHQLCDNLIHPVGIKECEFARLRDFQQIPVEEGIALFFFSRCGHCSDTEKAGVDALDDPSDHAALARGAPSFKNDHYGKLRFFDLHLESVQLLLCLFELFLKLFFAGLRGFDKILQHFLPPQTYRWSLSINSRTMTESIAKITANITRWAQQEKMLALVIS